MLLNIILLERIDWKYVHVHGIVQQDTLHTTFVIKVSCVQVKHLCTKRACKMDLCGCVCHHVCTTSVHTV